MIRAQIADAFAYGFGVAILIAEGQEGTPGLPYRALRIGENGARQWEVVTGPVAVNPTLTLEDSEARALLDALTRYYHGAEDTRALRRDYDAERKRVDGLIATVSDLARGLVSEP